jgi:putative PIG3 family NAD(P)H quinone oxidoreductase
MVHGPGAGDVVLRQRDNCMKAIRIREPGSPDVLELIERDAPVPQTGEVLIAVEAAGVNRPDLMQRQGRYAPPPGASDIPGLEVAGRIVALGPGPAPQSATGRPWSIGDPVCALVSGGGYAEQCVAPGVQCLPLPAGLNVTDAAGVPETFFTVWTNVFDRGRLREGEWLLAHGGASGIGTTAIQMAVARGARVIVTAGTDERCQRCVALGAAHGINYRNTDFVVAVRDLTAGRGVDVILDMVGAEYLPRNLECLARDGRLVQIATMHGTDSSISLLTVMTKRLTITGSTLRPRSPQEKGAIAAALEREIWPLVAAGRVRPIVDAILPLEQAAAAHARLEAGSVFGKLILQVG